MKKYCVHQFNLNKDNQNDLFPNIQTLNTNQNGWNNIGKLKKVIALNFLKKKMRNAQKLIRSLHMFLQQRCNDQTYNSHYID